MMTGKEAFLAALGDIEEATLARYSERLRKFGQDPRTLGWDTRQHQWARFEAVRACARVEDRDVLDIGCGLGDFRDFLEEHNTNPRSYRGIDINPDLLEVARSRFPNDVFERRSLLREPFAEPVCDVAVMLGLVNFKLKSLDNYHYAAEAIGAAFAACREALVVDMLSTCVTADYPPEEFVFYFDPPRMLALALRLTPWVMVHHAYPVLPQREFMLVLRRGPA